jgi:XapX domain-containing protein
MKPKGKKERNRMVEALVCLGVGLAIGVIFSLLKLPLPVPHGWGGVLGLIGMFVGGQIVDLIIRMV